MPDSSSCAGGAPRTGTVHQVKSDVAEAAVGFVEAGSPRPPPSHGSSPRLRRAVRVLAVSAGAVGPGRCEPAFVERRPRRRRRPARPGGWPGRAGAGHDEAAGPVHLDAGSGGAAGRTAGGRYPAPAVPQRDRDDRDAVDALLMCPVMATTDPGESGVGCSRGPHLLGRNRRGFPPALPRVMLPAARGTRGRRRLRPRPPAPRPRRSPARRPPTPSPAERKLWSPPR